MHSPWFRKSALFIGFGVQIHSGRGDGMRQIQNVVAVVIAGATALATLSLLSPSLAQPAQPTPAAPGRPAPVQPTPTRGDPCAQIAAACQQAGFLRGGGKRGFGLVLDCIQPIMLGVAQGVPGTMRLPQIDPQLVAACKQQNPNFGMARAPTPQSIGPSMTNPSGK
jgi:hypothetical protein